MEGSTGGEKVQDMNLCDITPFSSDIPLRATILRSIPRDLPLRDPSELSSSQYQSLWCRFRPSTLVLQDSMGGVCELEIPSELAIRTQWLQLLLEGEGRAFRFQGLAVQCRMIPKSDGLLSFFSKAPFAPPAFTSYILTPTPSSQVETVPDGSLLPTDVCAWLAPSNDLLTLSEIERVEMKGSSCVRVSVLAKLILIETILEGPSSSCSFSSCVLHITDSSSSSSSSTQPWPTRVTVLPSHICDALLDNFPPGAPILLKGMAVVSSSISFTLVLDDYSSIESPCFLADPTSALRPTPPLLSTPGLHTQVPRVNTTERSANETVFDGVVAVVVADLSHLPPPGTLVGIMATVQKVSARQDGPRTYRTCPTCSSTVLLRCRDATESTSQTSSWFCLQCQSYTTRSPNTSDLLLNLSIRASSGACAVLEMDEYQASLMSTTSRTRLSSSMSPIPHNHLCDMSISTLAIVASHESSSPILLRAVSPRSTFAQRGIVQCI